MGYKQPESVLVVLYDEHHRILLLQRNDDASFWQSVTGTIEAGEHPEQTAYREVREEIGLQLHPEHHRVINCHQTNRFKIRSQWLHRYPPGTLYNTEHVFTAQIPATTPIVLTEHSAYEWLDKPAAMARIWSPSNRDAVDTFVSGVN
ncbi:dihydroneopterin triphosphate diphosphatase [Alteromonas lipotrueiana]|uniref:dihydroneopterin triphosphate diphosphatase n=1 Tax=Alteromonas lipotrueiana TaxID=2803815 RepID=UPI001C4813E3|nr:dihydroneopterin triphosphate diphosphatase [Alteromonas lipotrueiana]